MESFYKWVRKGDYYHKVEVSEEDFISAYIDKSNPMNRDSRNYDHPYYSDEKNPWTSDRGK